MRRAPAALAVAAVLAGCGLQDPYPLPKEPPGDATFQAVAVGETVTEAVLFIEARTGTRVEILSAQAIGTLAGASVEFSASTLTEDDQGEVVVGDEHADLAGLRIDELADPRAEPPAEHGRDRRRDHALRARSLRAEHRAVDVPHQWRAGTPW